MSKTERDQHYQVSLITYLEEDSRIAEQFRIIRTNMKFLAGKKKKKTILITSPDIGDGKSMIAANLAISMTQQNEKVLLIDANIRHPVIHKMFNIHNEIGLTDLLLKKATFHEAVYQADIGRLDILTSGMTRINPTELIESNQMTDLLNKIVNFYNMIIIDSPAILKSTETRVLASQCDGSILVIRKGRTKQKEVMEANKLIELVDATLIGAIINKK